MHERLVLGVVRKNTLLLSMVLASELLGGKKLLTRNDTPLLSRDFHCSFQKTVTEDPGACKFTGMNTE